MPALIVRHAGRVAHHALTERETSVGREAAIAIDEPKLSRIHCRVVSTSLGWWVVDDGSTNGLWVGGTRVERHKLEPGILVELARRATIELTEEPPAPAPAPAPSPARPAVRFTLGWFASLAIHLVLTLLTLVVWIRAQQPSEEERAFDVVLGEDETREEAAPAEDPGEDAGAPEDELDPDVQEELVEAAPAEASIEETPTTPEAPRTRTREPRESDAAWNRMQTPLPFRIARPGGGGGEGEPDGTGDAAFSRHLETLAKNGLDVAILIDSTGSMGGVIDEAKRRLHEIALSIGRLVPGYSLRLYTYRDRLDPYVVRASSPDADVFESLVWLQGVVADGGGDEPEAVYQAVDAAVHYGRWRRTARRIIVVLGDAPPHAETEAPLLASVRNFHQAGGVVHTISTRGDVLPSFERIASTGGGQAVGFAEAEQVIREILVLALGSPWRERIEASLAGRAESPRERLVAEHANDVPWLVARLGAETVHPAIVEALIESGDRAALPLLADLIEAKKVPEANRWAALYTAIRIAGPALEVTPDDFRSRRRTAVARIRQAGR